jgi:GTP cyclohydrolase I
MKKEGRFQVQSLINMAWGGQVSAPPPVYQKDSHPSNSAKSTLSRLNSTAEEKILREAKLADAVRTVLECIGEDPDREGLQRTPARYAQALMWMTRGYEERLSGK